LCEKLENFKFGRCLMVDGGSRRADGYFWGFFSLKDLSDCILSLLPPWVLVYVSGIGCVE
jgi:hypothetical protein